MYYLLLLIRFVNERRERRGSTTLKRVNMNQYGVRKRSECRRSNKIKKERRDNGKKRTEKDESNEKERKIEKQKDRDS